MKKLRNWIKEHGSVKRFIEPVTISRGYFSDWELGKKRISLQIASRIVKHTEGNITYEDMVEFEKSFD